MQVNMRSLSITVLFALILFGPVILWAYNTEDTLSLKEPKTGGHEKMTDWSQRFVAPYFRVNWSGLRQGSRDEDEGLNPRNHFYNPATGFGMLPFQSAKDRAIALYGTAVKNYLGGVGSPFQDLGHSLHLLQDMAAPSHANAASHMWQSQVAKNGYEWWVTRNWDDKIVPYLANLQAGGWLAPIVAGDMAGYMEAMSQQTCFGGFPFDKDLPLKDSHTVGPEVAEPISMFLVPAAIKMGSGLVKTFCQQVGCNEPYLLPSHSSPGGGHPDDNFDVSSRLIELEELDVTKQAWKDLYGRTGIKKGYNGLFLEKVATEAFAKLARGILGFDFWRLDP